MPTISKFYGITVRMFFDEHGPPHFHVTYQGFDAAIGIETLDVQFGRLPRRALNLILDWAELHRDEPRANWKLIEEGRALNNIGPLE